MIRVKKDQVRTDLLQATQADHPTAVMLEAVVVQPEEPVTAIAVEMIVAGRIRILAGVRKGLRMRIWKNSCDE